MHPTVYSHIPSDVVYIYHVFMHMCIFRIFVCRYMHDCMYMCMLYIVMIWINNYYSYRTVIGTYLDWGCLQLDCCAKVNSYIHTCFVCVYTCMYIRMYIIMFTFTCDIIRLYALCVIIHTVCYMYCAAQRLSMLLPTVAMIICYRIFLSSCQPCAGT